MSNGGLEGSDALGSNLGEGGNTDVGGLGLHIGAGAIGSGVAVIGLEVSIVVLEVGKSTALPTTAATEAGLNTINELLLGEGEQHVR